jgi:hypothetical protein
MIEQWVHDKEAKDVGSYQQNQTFTAMRKNGWHWSRDAFAAMRHRRRPRRGRGTLRDALAGKPRCSRV